MKRLLLIFGFVVFWRQWENATTSDAANGNWGPVLVQESIRCDDLKDCQEFVTRHSKDERYTDMHIFRVGDEVLPVGVTNVDFSIYDISGGTGTTKTTSHGIPIR